MMSRKLQLCFVALMLFIWIPSALAQSAGTGALTGTVKDPTGAVVPNATVTLTSTDTNQARTATTGADGAYRFNLLPPGTYRVRFAAAGFKTSEVGGVAINVTETPVLDRGLEVGAQNEQVTVEANVETLQTASSTLGTTVGSRAATALPLTNRNYTQIIGLSGGANVGVNNATLFGKGSQDVSVNGANINQNNYQMDGVNVINFAGSGTGADSGIYPGIGIPNPDALEEFKIQTSTYDASFGRNPGANVNVVTKSGTNSVHGSLFEFFRNRDLNANDFFRNRNCALTAIALHNCEVAGGVKQTLNQNQFGGSVGMPIKKDKLFMFFSYQETRQLNGAGSQGYSSPNLPALPAGDRSNTAAFQAALGAMYCNSATSVANSIKVACDGSNINPVAISILQLKLPNGNYYVPASGAVAAGLTATSLSTPAQFTEHQAVANVDYLLNSKNTIAARFFTSQDPQTIPFTNANGELPGTPASYLYANTNAVLKLTTILTNNLVNEVRGSFQRNITYNQNGDPFTNTQVGMTPITPGNTSFNPLTITGAFNMGGGIGDDVFTPTNQFQEADMLSWTHGKNTVRAGGEFEHVQYDQGFLGIERGNTTINSFADFLIGRAGCAPAALQAGTCNAANPGASNGGALSNIASCTFCVHSGPTGIIHGYRVNDINFFGQDDYKVNSKLTVNMGVRWEYDGTLSDVYGNLTNVWTSLLAGTAVPGTPPTSATNPGAGYLAGYVVPSNFSKFYGTPATGVFQSSRILPVQSGPPLNNFAPRFGFAYQALPHLVIRGGFGLFYDRVGGNQFVHSVEQGNPYAVTLDFSGSGNQPSSLQQLVPNVPLAFQPRWANLTNLTYSGLNLPLLDQVIHTPLTRQYNLNFQYEFIRSWVLELGFVGSSGINQTDYNHNINPAGLASPSNPINGFTTNTLANVNFRVPYLGYQPAGLQQTSFDGIYNYNSLQATVRKQYSHGFTLQGSYTWSKNLTDLEGYGANSNLPTALGQQYGNAYFNRPQRFVFNYNWELPLGHAKGVLGAITGGWVLSGVTIAQAGTPLTFTDARAGTIYGLSGNNSGTTPTALGAVTFGAYNYGRAQIAPGVTYGALEAPGSVEARLGGSSGGTGFFTPGSFIAPPVIGNGTDFGNSGVGIVRGPGQFNFDFSLVKNTRVGGIHENANLQYRLEFFNAFNHPQFNNPGTSVTAATYGVITSTSVNPRLIQMALKYTF
jgi:hypothetical protein